MAAAAAATAAAATGAAAGQRTNNQTPFSKHSRNGKTPPNFVPKMTQNQSQEQVPWRPERPFWNPTKNFFLSCYILLEI